MEALPGHKLLVLGLQPYQQKVRLWGGGGADEVMDKTRNDRLIQQLKLQ